MIDYENSITILADHVPAGRHSSFDMNTNKLIGITKRFLGPIVCVTFGWLALRWAAGIIAVAKLWPWCGCSPVPPQTYFLAVVGVISFGLAPLWLLGAFVYLGWQWFRKMA